MTYNECQITKCPLCGGGLTKKWTYDCRMMQDYNMGFNPIRTWMECKDCRHLVASAYPRKLFDTLNEHVDKQYSAPNYRLPMTVFSDTMVNIGRFMPFGSLLDVGCGGGELALTAQDFGYDVKAIDLRDEYVKNLRALGVEAYQLSAGDTVSQLFDVICLGDVIEHTLDPVNIMTWAGLSLKENGVVWISTPDYTGAVARILGDGDPMRRVVEHIQYFSKDSLYKLLRMTGFVPVDFRLSKRYIGSVEVIAEKEAK